MKFIRLTSFLLCCALLSSFLILPASAADDDNYYSLPVVSDVSSPVLLTSLPSAMYSSATSWSTDDRATLNGIYKFIQYLTTAPSSYSDNSVIGLLHRILAKSGSSGSVPNADTNFQLYRNGTGTNGLLFDIFNEISDVLPYGYGTNVLSWLSSINSNVMKADTTGLATESTLSSFEDLFSSFAPINHEWPGTSISIGSYLSTMFALTTNNDLSSGDFNSNFNKGFAYNVWVNPVEGSISPVVSSQFSWSGFVSTLLGNFIYDGIKPTGSGGGPTIYRMLRLLQETLASEDDRQLAENQKENRDQIEKDFLTGTTGKTSLGKDDFGSLSSVGGTFHDISSLNGQASLDSFSSGLSDADSAGQGWFSQSTKEALDSVSGSTTSESTVSTFSNDGLYSVDVDSDPYNMGNFQDNYSWLWGDK
ncbi:hypothetical protein [Inovirus sp.]|nr:hypothetical protein [Inovirus sp.]